MLDLISSGLPLAGQPVTLRLDGPVVRILFGGILTRTVACPVPQDARSRRVLNARANS